jgi:hypothetical protein
MAIVPYLMMTRLQSLVLVYLLSVSLTWLALLFLVISTYVCFSDENLCFTTIVAASTAHADTFYTVSAMGEVCSHTIRADVYEEIVDHRFKDSSSRDVEIAVQARDLTAAFSRVIQISRTQRKEGFLLADNESELIQLCTIRPPMKADSWKMANPNLSITEEQTQLMKSAFKKDLDEFIYCIPPRYGEFENWTKEVDTFYCNANNQMSNIIDPFGLATGIRFGYSSGKDSL